MTSKPVKPVSVRGSRVTLLLLSGGIDSTYLLQDLLRNTDEIVLAHHVHMINAEGRHEAEAKACRDIVTYCKRQFRNFYYTESAVDRRRFRAAGADVITVAFEGGIAASNYLLDTGIMPYRWMLGVNSEEAAYLGARLKERLPHLQAAMTASTWPNKPPAYFHPEERPKAQLIHEMGPELTNLCWTCRRPIKREDGGFNECGKCKTCELMDRIRSG